MVTRALFVLVLLAEVAGAHPILVDRVPPPPPPPTLLLPAREELPPPPPRRSHLGYRIGAGAFPLDGIETTAVALVQVTADVELFRRTRTFAEYEFLMLMQSSAPMEPSPSGVGHRGNLGLSTELAGKRVRDARLYVAAEAGGGATLISAALGARTLPHAFGGIRFGFELVLDRTKPTPPTFGFELLFRGVVVPDGAGLLFGLGMQWGE